MAESLKLVLNPMAFTVVFPTASCVVALGVLLALAGDIRIPVVAVGVLPFFV